MVASTKQPIVHKHLSGDDKGQEGVGGAASHTHGDRGRIAGALHGQGQILSLQLDVDLVVRVGRDAISVEQHALCVALMLNKKAFDGQPHLFCMPLSVWGER